MVAIAGELGMEIQLPMIPVVSGLAASQILYSESCGRFIITVAPEKKEAFENIFSGMKIEQVGFVTESHYLSMRDAKGRAIIEEDVFALKDSWKKRFGELI
jgi:phosphoribosylformylglycinamidine synthase